MSSYFFLQFICNKASYVFQVAVFLLMLPSGQGGQFLFSFIFYFDDNNLFKSKCTQHIYKCCFFLCVKSAFINIEKKNKTEAKVIIKVSSKTIIQNVG